MALKSLLYFFAILLFIGSLSYSESVVTASIRATATVVQPIGLSSFSVPELIDQENDLQNEKAENNHGVQLLLRIPHEQSAVCLIETTDGKQTYFSVSGDLVPINSIDGQSDIKSPINQITLIFSEN